MNDNTQINWQYLQLIKLHSLFIVNNHELTGNYRQDLINVPVIESIIKERERIQLKLEGSQVQQFIGFLGAVMTLMFLFIVILKRQQHQLKETSLKYQKAVAVKTQFLDQHVS
eukprot:TRINITY_DN9232_c0_g1_i1.p1 TRINITY_DN9232_c0_g1~~TRINITY_DN9232_c0_g1_i1.p1  ORF type:complete len:113 (-),score=2.47 TRINITY_DN9232_c0_g1_i1:31-369(-)